MERAATGRFDEEREPARGVGGRVDTARARRRSGPARARALAAISGLLLAGCAARDAADDASRVSWVTGATSRQALTVGFVIVDGVYNTELTAPWDMFHHTVFHADPGLSVFSVAPTLDPVTTFEGLRILPDYTFDDAPRIDVLVVPSAEHNMDSDLEDEALISFVRERGRAAMYVLSLCDGAFVLAQAGLLDGKRATTFPSDIARMREMFPKVEVLDGPSFVHHGRMITSVGGAPSFDAALYLCERLWGASIARGIAAGLVIDWDLKGVEHVVVE